MFLKPCARKVKNQREKMGELEHRPGSIIVLWVMTVMPYCMSEIKLYIFAAGVFIKDTYFPARRKVGVQNFFSFELSCLSQLRTYLCKFKVPVLFKFQKLFLSSWEIKTCGTLFQFSGCDRYKCGTLNCLIYQDILSFFFVMVAEITFIRPLLLRDVVHRYSHFPKRDKQLFYRNSHPDY